MCEETQFLATFQHLLLMHCLSRTSYRSSSIPVAFRCQYINLISFQYRSSNRSEQAPDAPFCHSAESKRVISCEKVASVHTLYTESCFWADSRRRRSGSPTWTLVRCRYMTQATWKHTHSTSSSSTSIPLREQRRDQSEKGFPSFPLTAVKTPFFLIASRQPHKIDPITLHKWANCKGGKVCVCACVYVLWDH